MSPRVRQTLAVTLPGSHTRGVAVLALFVAVQAADASFTAAGLARFGHSIEANPLLSFFIEACGASGALLAAKLLAIAGAITLHLRSQHLPLAVLTVGYVYIAIVPWAWALQTLDAISQMPQ